MLKKIQSLLFMLGTLGILMFALGLSSSVGVSPSMLLYVSLAFFVVGGFLPKLINLTEKP